MQMLVETVYYLYTKGLSVSSYKGSCHVLVATSSGISKRVAGSHGSYVNDFDNTNTKHIISHTCFYFSTHCIGLFIYITYTGLQSPCTSLLVFWVCVVPYHLVHYSR
jgi:hypothetical protein